MLCTSARYDRIPARARIMLPRKLGGRVFKKLYTYVHKPCKAWA